MKTKIVHRHFKGIRHQTEVIGPSNYFDFRFKVLDSPALAVWDLRCCQTSEYIVLFVNPRIFQKNSKH